MLLIKSAKKALQLVNNNEAIINELRQENQKLQEKIKFNIIDGKKDTVRKYITKDSSIQRNKAQLEGVLIGIEDIKNRLKTTILIFTNIKEEN